MHFGEETVLLFKAKTVSGHIKLPKFARRHVAQCGSSLNPYINSDMLEAVISRELRKQNIPSSIDINNIPENISIENGFLSTVKITLP